MTWPLLLTSALVTVLLPGSASCGSAWVLLAKVIPLVVAAILLVRGLCRWAKGVPTSEGGKRHPGVGPGISLSAAVLVFGPLLAIMITNLMPSPDGREADDQELAELEAAMNRIVEADPLDPLSDDGILWRLGRPEVTVALAMQEGQKATLRAFLRDAGGNTWDFNLGDTSYRPELPRAKVIFEFGTELYDTMQRLVITRSVPDGRLIRSLEDLRGWEFNGALPEVIAFDSVGKHEVQIAANKGRPAETLILEVVVTK